MSFRSEKYKEGYVNRHGINKVGFFKRKPKYGGLVAYYKIENFWFELSLEEKSLIRKVYSNKGSWTGELDPETVDSKSVDIKWTSITSSHQLSNWGKAVENEGNYQLAEKLYFESLRLAKNPIDTHFSYYYLSNLYFKQVNDKDPKNLIKCIEYCHLDIDLFEKFDEAWRNEYIKEEITEIPIPSFVMLAEIYEKQGEFLKALNIYEKLPDHYYNFDSKFNVGWNVIRLLNKTTEYHNHRFDKLLKEYEVNLTKGIRNVREFISLHHAINQKNLISGISEKYSLYSYQAKFIIDEAIKREQIYRIKKGRAYQYFISSEE